MSQDHLAHLADDVLAQLLAGGVTDAKVVARAGNDLSVRVRIGEDELVEEAGTQSIAVRVLKNRRVATSSTNDLTRRGLQRLVSDALELVELSREDPAAAFPDPADLATDPLDLALCDPACGDVSVGEALSRARRGEEAAFAFDSRITNSDESTFARTTGGFVMVTSGGFRGGYEGSYASLSVSPVAADQGGMRRTARYWTAHRVLAKLEDDTVVGRKAARRTVSLLGARRVRTQEVPVVFDPDAARALLGAFVGCVTGDAILRRASFLVNRLGDTVASDLITLVDDPLIPTGPGSRPFDGDGLPARRNVVVEKGVLRTYLLDVYGARKLGMQSTGSCSSHIGTGAGASNFFLAPGAVSHDEILRSTRRGLYVTDLVGFGFNAVTGDFSRGAVGYWIEGGELAFPVSAVTVSLNFNDLLARIDAVGDDLDLKTSVASPTIRVSRMNIAGS